MFTWALKPNKIKHRLIWWRNVGSLTFFACICFVMAPKSRYLKSVNHKIVTWNTNRPRRLYFTIFFNLLFLYFSIFSLNCICCHLFSADNISVFTYNFIHIQFHVIYIKSYILPTNIPAKNLKIVLGITEFQNENNAISVG
jgi:hypothetical protein